MVSRSSLRIILLAAWICLWSSAAFAGRGCPLIHGLIDFNCDGKIKIVFTGDSIVKGVGDSDSPIEGYPGRLQEHWPWAEIENLGVPGATSGDLLRSFKQTLTRKPNGNTSLSIHGADLVVITVGVNDFYSGQSAGATVSNVVQLINFLKKKLKKDDGTSPLIVVGTVLYTLRGFQQPFVRSLDGLYLRYNSRSNLPVAIRFDQVPVGGNLLNRDGLHPNGNGYDEMASVAAHAIQTTVQRLMARARSDKDDDGLYDQLEPVFGTDPKKADTDGDGIADGDEIFDCHTDPTKADSDGDGMPDTCATPAPAAEG